MRKTRNFFLAVLGFFCLSVAFFIFSELAWVDKDGTAAVTAAPTTEVKIATFTPEGNPGWLIPYDQITFQCDHPWVIRRELPGLDHDTIERIRGDLSECYQLAGEQAVESHLWQQGIKSSFRKQEGNIELFFKHDAGFERLGLAAPDVVNIAGTVVHDLNGDAVFNPGEPIVSDAKICINREPLSPLCAQSGSDGQYSFKELLPGAWHFRIYSPTIDRLNEFKYTNQLIEANHIIPETTINGHTLSERSLNQTEFNSIENETLILVDQNMARDFFLMHEWATYFAAPKDIHLFQIEAYYDLDVRKGVTRVFNGEHDQTYDQHDGLDSSCPAGTEVVSVAEGRVIAILYNSTVAIRHSNQLISVYGHGDPLVEENQFVPRGYPVALCNNNLTESGPHLHFAVWQSTPWLHRVSYGIPPYADLAITKEKWVANHAPLEKDYFVYLLQGGRGVWTEINQPHLPYVEMVE